MSATSASPAETVRNEPVPQTILVWDAPVRVFHWLMVVCFAGAWITAESERWRLVHVTLGYTMAGLVAFRLLWGIIGSHHARFTNWVRGPRAVTSYAGEVLRGKPTHYTGHNPLGAVAILLMLVLVAAITASGWATYNDFAGSWLVKLHEGAATFMLAVVAVHVVGVVLSSWLHHENLIGAMIHGHKSGKPQEGTRNAWRSVAAILLAAVLGFWWLQWNSAPNPAKGSPAAAASVNQHERHRD